MAILDHVDPSEFTHKGWVAFCPVYITELDSGEPVVCERNWVPQFVLLFAGWCQQGAMWFLSSMFHEYDPLFAIKVTGKIGEAK